MRPVAYAVLVTILAWLMAGCSPPSKPSASSADSKAEVATASPGPAPPPPPATQDDSCRIPGVDLAHCPQAVRNFHAALVAVHGWNGSCGGTFGQEETSLYTILGKRKFYDWDCFQYDSRHLSIAQNVKRLREQLQRLKAGGYRRVLLATHSTGGILALDLLAGEFKAGPPSDDLPRVAAVLAWATPINGMRPGISAAGRVLSRAGFSPQTLPDLNSGSPYLTDLKARLSQCNRRYLDAQGTARGKLEFKIWFLQGQGNDMVVRPISGAVAAAEGWYVPDRDQLIETGEGHTHNVGAAGTQPAPRYPAKFLDLNALLNLRVDPRYDEVFPSDIVSLPQSLEKRQAEVVEGLTYFAENNFPGAFTPSLDFLRRMYLGSFARSSAVDETLVHGFLDLLKQKAGTPDEDLVRFLVSFVNRVLLEYDPTPGEDIRLVGHGNSDIAQAILETADVIRREVMQFLGNHPESAYILAPLDVDTFNARLVAFLTRFLRSPHGPAQYAALSKLASALPALSDPTVVASGAVTNINDYYLGGGYLADADPKIHLRKIYIDLAARGPEIHAATLKALNTEVPYLGSQRPAWVAFADDATVRTLLATIEPEAEGTKREQLRFAAEVAARAGATGKDTAAARGAIDVGEKILAHTRDRALRRELETELKRGVERSGYPDIERTYEPPP